MKSLNKLNKMIQGMICILPLVLFFSYYPLMHFGSDESMNFEISLPLIWLVLFDLVTFFVLIKRKKLFSGLKGKWVWLLFPIFLTISVFWSLNSLRGALTVGIVWLIYFAGYAMYSFRELFDKEFLRKFLKWFFGSTVVICLFCFLQCILDLSGVLREYSLLCAGCTYTSFGFPHPNGFAIEPQFMGNLLLAPSIITAWLIIRKLNNKKLRRKSIEKQNHRKLELEHSRDGHFYNRSVGLASVFQYRNLVRDCCKNDNGSCSLCSNFLWFCFFIVIATLFLTFSRGAIYAFMVAMIFLTAVLLVREKGKVLKRVFGVWVTIALAFLFTLNAQGIMAAVSPTNDTYQSGIAKALNHLSLGTIDFRQKDVAEKPVENFKEEWEENESVFDGYVAESTNTRLRLSGAAVMVWKKDFRTMLFGVGLGGAGRALYENDLSPAPKEIVQNQYASLLLETGLVGVMLFVLTMVLIVKSLIKNSGGVLVLSLIVAYGVSLVFFSGLPNALHIYLLPELMYLFDNKVRLS
ncbi:O-antigen ligase family protein [Candidatus Saccharibacteria bacterium]|nr:O-antigen ligase family protein [Candidatus Saccharibacteria bacterium]